MRRPKGLTEVLAVLTAISLGSCTALLGLDREFGDASSSSSIGGSSSSTGGHGGGGTSSSSSSSSGGSDAGGTPQWAVALSSAGAGVDTPTVGGVTVDASGN